MFGKQQKNNALIGYTGFVGSELHRATSFNALFNSANIASIKDHNFDLVVCAAPSATKWLANKEPQADFEKTTEFVNYLKMIKTKFFIHISTIDVYGSLVDVDENTSIAPRDIHPYGRHRFYIEEAVRDLFDNFLIIRLPGLFGHGLKKNFIYDLMHSEPRFINQERFYTIISKLDSEQNHAVQEVYRLQDNGMYGIRPDIDIDSLQKAGQALAGVGMTSLAFTHSESCFQFYDIKQLWRHIQIATEKRLSLVNFATEPIAAKEIAKVCLGINFDNQTEAPPIYYNMKSKYATFFGRDNGYLVGRDKVLSQIKQYIREEKFK